MNNSWSWFDDKKNLRHYEFQTMLDILSFAENLPLRVMDYDALCRVNIAELWYLNDEHNTETLEDIKKQSHKFCQHVKTLFTDIKKLQDNPEYHQDTDKFEIAFQKILNKNKKINPPPAFNALKNSIDPLIELEKSVWHNQPSNPLPVHSLFRHCEEWRWWVFFWFFCEREKLKAIASSNNHFSGDAFFMDSWEFYIQWITLDESDKKYLLVVGPIYKEQGLNSTTKQFYIRYGKTLKLCYKAFHKCYTKGSLTHLAHDDIIRRMVHAQLLPLSKQEVKKRVSSIKAILRMLQVALTKNPQLDYSYHDIYTITYYLIFLERMSSILESGEYVFHFSFSYPKQNGILSIMIQVDKSKLNGERIINITITENCHEKPQSNYPLQSIEYSLDTEEKQIQQFDNQKIESFNSKIEYWNETYDVRRKAAQEIHIALLGEWLKNHYGSLDEENKDSSKNTRFYNYICHNILNWVRADECNLFRFKHAQQAIDLIGHVTLAKLGEKWNSEKITKEINELNNKEDSAVFRAISNNKNIFIPKNYPNNPQFYISPSYTTDCSPCSCMIVPITFQGRIYGALEVIGFSDYQFQWSHELIFTNVAHLIANYIYSQQMLFALQEITRLALQSSGVAQTVKNEKNGAYTPLCEQLSKIFLSKCANLWIKDSTNHHIYSFRGNTHATLFNGCEHEFNINENRNYVASYLIDQYVKQGKTYVVGSVDTGIAVSHFDENQQLYIIGNDSPDTKLRNIIINDLKAKELLVFLLINERRQDNNNREQNIGILHSGLKVVDTFDVNKKLTTSYRSH
ncbi:MAG: GAF domain-containing protein [Methylococcales bacterium]|nr:MAG: GAF domain-containing protein [Methylococcales bacterium]